MATSFFGGLFQRKPAKNVSKPAIEASKRLEVRAARATAPCPGGVCTGLNLAAGGVRRPPSRK